MADGLTEKRSGWRKPVLAGLIGVWLVIAAVFSRLTNPPAPLIFSFAVAGLGLLGVRLYVRSGARDREERMSASLDEAVRLRLRKQKPLSIALAVALILLVCGPVVLSFFATWVEPGLYNGMIGVCLTGMVVWCIAAAIGHSARHSVLDEHERTVGEARPKVR
jgi:hypothetical protein